MNPVLYLVVGFALGIGLGYYIWGMTKEQRKKLDNKIKKCIPEDED